MIQWILKKIIGSKNQREVKKLIPLVRKINELEEQLHSLSEDDLKAKTAAWKEELSSIDDPHLLQSRVLDILPEAFAVVKNTARRLCNTSWMVCDQTGHVGDGPL